MPSILAGGRHPAILIPSRSRKEVTLPNLKVYGCSLVVAAVLAAVALFTLGTPGTPKLSPQPPSFDGARAMADLRTIATEFPQRQAGSVQDGRATLWLVDQLKQIGLDAGIESFPAQGGEVGLQNVYAVDRGDMHGTIVLVANRDVIATATQGANDNASGTAALLELARSFTVTSHRHTLVFLWTDGDAEGTLGTRDFVARHDVDDVLAVVGVRGIASVKPAGLEVAGWSSVPRLTPPWLWLLTAPAARATGVPPVELPGPGTQLLRLAAPLSDGLQAPFVAAGAPAVQLSIEGPDVSPPADTLDAVSEQTLTRVGTMVQRMVMTIDSAKVPTDRSDGTIFLTKRRTLPGSSLALLLLALTLPLLAVTVDLFAQCRRERVAMRSAWRVALLGAVPWLAFLGLLYGANLVSALPRGAGGVTGPHADLVAHPHYLRIALLLATVVLVGLYVVAVERRSRRRDPVDGRALVLVAHAGLLLIAAALALVNVYSLLLVLPAALLWPLARPGRLSSVILAPAGLAMVAAAAVHCALASGLGVDVWWYLLLVLETRELPVFAAVLGALFLSTTVLYARALWTMGAEARSAPLPATSLAREAGLAPDPGQSPDAEPAALVVSRRTPD
jgi:hypothetical protein